MFQFQTKTTTKMLPIPIDRMSGRRSSSIGCRSILNRRTSIYFTTPSHSERPPDPFKVSFKYVLSYQCLSVWSRLISRTLVQTKYTYMNSCFLTTNCQEFHFWELKLFILFYNGPLPSTTNTEIRIVY